MPTGTVDFYKEKGTYGFIVTEASDEDVFFYMTNGESLDIEGGDEVEFQITQGEKGPRAANVNPL